MLSDKGNGPFGKKIPMMSLDQWCAYVRHLRTTAEAVGARADHHHKIYLIQNCMQVSRINIRLVANVTIPKFFLYTNLKYFMK
jgi:hypothetical protein